ncbi:sensor histidine kinase [Butyricimonas muris]|uniref:sensor histidine kinase n=1 Tax=Butyricimonas muris TaxID=3378067 RepID=UPI0039675473
MPTQDTYKYGNQFWEKFLIHPRFRIIRHLIILFLLGIIVLKIFFEEYGIFFGLNTLTIINVCMVLLFWGLICLNIYILIPNYLYKGKYGIYLFYLFITIMSLLLVMTGVIIFSKEYFPAFYEIAYPGNGFLSFYFANFLGIFFYISAVSITIFLQRWIAHNRQLQELEKNKVQTELTRLRDQIQPDFLSRMLNTANVLAKKDADKASTLLLQLSHLLRYQLYDSTREKVLLSAEISFIKDYMNLEKLHDDNFTFHISAEETIDHVLVPPLLFIPIVELAIRNHAKYRSSEPDHIYMLFRVNEEKLYFACIYPEDYSRNNDSKLENLRQRLHLLYGDEFQLEAKQGDKNHVISLQICL